MLQKFEEMLAGTFSPLDGMDDPFFDEAGGSHIVVTDADGSAVSVTSTLTSPSVADCNHLSISA